MTDSRRTYVIRLLAVWGWMGVCTLAVMAASSLLGHGFAFSREVGAFPWLMLTYAAVGVGLLPLVISLAARDDWRAYGLGRAGLRRGLVHAAGFVAFVVLMASVFGQVRLPAPPAFALRFPFDVLFVTLATLAWGPLEVFFVLWLVVNTDRLFGSGERVLSIGVVATLLLFGAAHLVVARGGVGNAAAVTVIFFVLAVVFQRTKSAYGPMLAWTCLNPQVWAFWRLLFP